MYNVVNIVVIDILKHMLTTKYIIHYNSHYNSFKLQDFLIINISYL